MSDTTKTPNEEIKDVLDQLDIYISWSTHFMNPEEYEPAETAFAKAEAFIRFVSDAETARILSSKEYSDFVTAALVEMRGVITAPENQQLRLVP